jgi:hypothetical protein
VRVGILTAAGGILFMARSSGVHQVLTKRYQPGI